MKRFKQADLFINLLLIVSGAVAALIHTENMLIAYFVVGGWQVFSMLVHAYNHCFTYAGGSRTIYHWITLIAVVTMPAGSFWLLLFAAPFMAAYYAWICYREVYVKMKRPLSVLK